MARIEAIVGWAKALAEPFCLAETLVRRAHATLADRVGTAYDTLSRDEKRCQRLCPPYGDVRGQ